jgi:hypothetical protein
MSVLVLTLTRHDYCMYNNMRCFSPKGSKLLGDTFDTCNLNIQGERSVMCPEKYRKSLRCMAS